MTYLTFNSNRSLHSSMPLPKINTPAYVYILEVSQVVSLNVVIEVMKEHHIRQLFVCYTDPRNRSGYNRFLFFGFSEKDIDVV